LIFDGPGHGAISALVFIGAIALIGALSYIFIVGDIKRIVLVD